MRDSGINIKKATYDFFGSNEARQILDEQGIETESLSVDRNDQAYLALVNLYYEGRIEHYDYAPYRKELFDLIHDRKRRKVDHPAGSCLLGDTQIRLMDGGVIPIQDTLAVGAFPVYGESCGRIVPVVGLKGFMSKMVVSAYTIHLSNGYSFGCTGNHPLMLFGGEKYIPAENSLGRGLQGVWDSPVMVVGVEKRDFSDPQPVFDIEVPATDNFLLAGGVIVHNSKDVADSFAGAVFNALSDDISEAFSEGNDIDILVDEDVEDMYKFLTGGAL